ncbi:MAG TPA: hypothetical protein VFI65_25885 [Streptosporangiaceae bacterium]|nr:hypothetical protein [Streptosporangiaceae bacterium]
MRRESSTVVALVGEPDDRLVSGLAQSANVSVAWAPDKPGKKDRPAWEAGALALRDAGKLRSTYVVVADDPLADVAASWQAMWDLSGGPEAAAEFERQATEVLAAWKAKRFELPDYYLVAAKATEEAPRPDLYLGPLRSVRPRRVTLAVTELGATGIASGGLIAGTSGSGPTGTAMASSGDQVARVVSALRSLQHGPWWPPLDELLDAARQFYPGALTETG